jgi:hypothetical protein
MIHGMILGHGPRYVLAADGDGNSATDWRKKATREHRDAILAAGDFPVLEHELSSASRCADALSVQLREHSVDREDPNSQSEMSVVWVCPTSSGSVWCRARIDHWAETSSGVMITDLKTIHSADADSCARAVRSFGYDVQMAAYTEALSMAYPDLAGRIRFQLAFLELDPVPLVHVVQLDDAWAHLGRTRWERAKHRWAHCLSSNEWPGYPQNTVLEAPQWLLRNG